MDGFSDYYSDFLDGQYDCVDRIANLLHHSYVYIMHCETGGGQEDQVAEFAGNVC